MFGLLGTLARVVQVITSIVRTVQAVAHAVQSGIQQVFQPSPSTPSSPTQAPKRQVPSATRSQADFSEQAQRREQQQQRQLQGQDVGKDISQRQRSQDWDTPRIPNSTQQNTSQTGRNNLATLSKPAGQTLQWLVNPDARQIAEMASEHWWLVERALARTPTSYQAFGFLLAKGVNLISTEINEIIDEARLDNSSQNLARLQLSPCPNGWVLHSSSNSCVYVGNSINVAPNTTLQEILNQEVGGDQRFGAILPPQLAFLYTQRIGNTRGLFFNPAEMLNNRAVTNMSNNALAALVFSQVFAEEKWHKGLGWINPYYNRGDDPTPAANDPLFWIAGLPYTTNDKRATPGFISWLASSGDWEAQRVATDENAFLINREPEKSYLTRGIGYGLGNQTFPMTWEAAVWYFNYSTSNPTSVPLSHLPTNVFGYLGNSETQYEAQIQLLSELGDQGMSMLNQNTWSPNFGKDSQFWNVMRFVFAGAAQREGTTSPQARNDYYSMRNYPETNQPGRPIEDVSAFSLLTTVYSGSVTVPEFALYDVGKNTYFNIGTDNSATINERNKAIRDIERLVTDEGRSRILAPLGIDSLSTQYEKKGGDFLPYSREEAIALVNALVQEAQELDASSEQAKDAHKFLCDDQAPLLKQGYNLYAASESKPNWDTVVGDICK